MDISGSIVGAGQSVLDPTKDGFDVFRLTERRKSSIYQSIILVLDRLALNLPLSHRLLTTSLIQYHR
jgi:hypothetical protein